MPGETRSKNPKRKFIANATHGTSSRPEDLGRVAWKIPRRNTYKKNQSENLSRTRHTARVPDLRILGASPSERPPGETHTKISKRTFIANAAHGTSSRPQDIGRAAWKIPRRNTYKKFKAKTLRERGTLYEFPTWGSWARRLKDPQEKGGRYLTAK